MRGLVQLVPRELLRQEIVAAGLGDELRKGRGIAEDIGQPDILGLVSKLLHEEALAMQQLADQRFARRQVAVWLDPHRADRFPLPDGDLLAHPPVDVGIGLFHPRVLGRL